MADNRNFAALDWLVHEIGETLKEARQALEAYVENPKDAVRIRFCLTHIHQVHGSLQMVEFFGAAMLAEEMERLTQAMIQGTVANTAEAQEVLMRAILQFPVYLEQVKATRKDNPLVVLPLLNDLRAVRGESLLTDTKLFVPNLAPAKKVSGARSPAAQDNVQFQAMALKLRQMYQYAAAGYIRSVNSDENLAYLQKAFTRLQKLTQGTARFALWDICLALAEALEIDALEISVAIKNLLRQLDKEIKILAVHGTKALNSYTNDELIKNLLYYVARAGKHAPGFTPNSHLKRIYETYRLEDALIEGKETGDESNNMLSSPDPDAMRSVVEALKAELDIVKHSLDICLSGGDSTAALNEALPVVKRIADTMAVLGLGDLRKQVLEQGAALEMMANSNSQLSHDQLMAIAGKVIETEDALDQVVQQQSLNTNSNSLTNDADITLSRAKESVLRESRNGLEHAKDAIIEYIASQWDRTHLQNVPDTLREIRGGLEIMPLPRAARILSACARYIEEQLLSTEMTPQWSSLDTLADAITSVEYYLERLSGGSTKEENDLLLSVAEESVAALGYAVAATSRSETVAADLKTELESVRIKNALNEVHTTPEAAEEDEASLAAAYESALQSDEVPEIVAEHTIELPTNTLLTSDDIVSVDIEPESIDLSSAEISVHEEITLSASTPATTDDKYEPPSLSSINAPTVGNLYAQPETTVVVATGLHEPVDVALGAITAAADSEMMTEAGDDDESSLAAAYETITQALAPDDEENSVPVPDVQMELPQEPVADVVEAAVTDVVSDVVEVSQPALVDEDDGDDIDDEIIEIFVEEAGEVLETIAEYFPRWSNDFSDEEALIEFRRAFHTLKGSGRMVGANDIGELSWSIENMLNRVLDKTIAPARPHVAIIEATLVILPSMVEAFSVHEPNPHPELSLHYRSLAESLSKGVVPAELQLAEKDAASTGEEFHTTFAIDSEAETADDNIDAVDDLAEAIELVLPDDIESEILSASVVDDSSLENDGYVEKDIAAAQHHAASSIMMLDDGDDADAQLWDIFGAEALTHLQVVQDFIAHMEAEAPCYEAPSDSIQRALHTLKGSAHMAEITPIAELAAPLEKFVKELRSYHVVINDDILQLLRDAVSYTQVGLKQIENNQVVDIPKLHQFVARVHELREIHVVPLVRQQELDEHGKRPVDPELLSIFMAEEMNLLLDADKIIAQWAEHPHILAVLTPVLDELRNLTRGAHHAYLPAMAALGEKLEQVYSEIISGRLSFSHSLCEHLNCAHVALLDMVDAIAAGQNISTAPAHIIDELDALLAQAANQSVSDILAADDVAEIAAAEIVVVGANDDEHIELADLPGVEHIVVDLDIPDDIASSTTEHIIETTAVPAFESLELEEQSDSDEVTLDVLDSIELGPVVSEAITDEDIELSGIDFGDEIILEDESSSDEELSLEDDITLADVIVTEDVVPTLPVLDAIVSDEHDVEMLSDDELNDIDIPIATLDDAVGVAAELTDEAVHDLHEKDNTDSELVEAFTEISVSDIVLGDDDFDADGLQDAIAANQNDETIELEFESADDDHHAEELSLHELLIDDADDDELLEELIDEYAIEDSATETENSDESFVEQVYAHSEAGHVQNDYIAESDTEEFAAKAEIFIPEVAAEMIPDITVATVAPTVTQRADASVDDEFDPEIVEIFIEEALELLEDMERALHEWQEDWNNTECAEELKRCLHTFKGGARLSGLTGLGDLSHDFETLLIDMDATTNIDQQFFKQLNTYQDQLHAGVDNARAKLNAGEFGAEQVVPADSVLDDAATPEAVAQTLPVSLHDDTELPSEHSKPTLVVDNSERVLSSDPGAKPNVLTFAPKPKPLAAPLPKIPGSEFGGSRQGHQGQGQVQHLATRRAGPQEVVKVSAELLEELVNLAGETSISRSRMEQQVSDLGSAIEEMDSTIHRLQEQLRRLDIETEAQVLFRQEQMAQHEEFDPLEMDRYSQLQQLSRSLIESASDLMDLKYTLADKTRDTETLLLQQSRINTDLQEGLMRSRMVPFSRLVPRLRRIVRQAATELGKEVEFELDNVEGELDRTVLERMVAPLEHMLRNAVDHGIESPDGRTAAGKPLVGRIVLSLSREGGDVMLRLADDGRGINLQRVREKAIERGLMAEDAPLSDQDLMQFILHAGFSTADKITQISGRGVGMDVVHSEIKQLGGAMFIDSRWGEGTEFTIRLPFTVSVNRALMVQIGDDLYAIPLNTIEGIVRVSPFELEHYYQDAEARFDYAGDEYLVRYLGTMLDSDAMPKLDGQALPLPVILVRSTENTVALQVDRLLGSREIVVKTLGAQFSAVRGVSGATVTGDGSVVVILDLHALIREQLALGLSNAMLLEPLKIQTAVVEEELVEKTVMVVDDSVTVRKVTGRFLEREGFRVISAKDGVEALQLLQDHVPDVMLLDIEMPRMDGFEVAKNIRTSSRLRDIPIIMITSRTGEKHRERAFELGVNKYMGKPYQEDLLLSNIQELLK